MNKMLFAACAASLLALASPEVDACGETLFRTGQGMRYNSYAAPRPATVLIYADAAAVAAGTEAELRKGLEKAGHKVTVVADAEALSTIGDARPFDVVIADLAAIDALTETLGSEAESSRFVPVVARDDKTERALRERFAWCVREGAGVGQYLKAINKVMEARLK